MRFGKPVSRRRVSALSLAVFSSFGAATALGQTRLSVWTDVGGDSLWSDASNWLPSGAPNNGTGGFTDYNVVIGAPSPTNVDSTFTIDSMTVTNLGLVNILGSSVLNLNGPTLTNNSTITVNSAAQFAGTTFNLNGVTVSGTGTIVLNDDDATTTAALDGTFILGSTSAITGRGQINAAFTNNGTVNANIAGHGITLTTDSTNNKTMESTGGTLTFSSIIITQGAGGQVLAGSNGLTDIANSTVSGGTLATTGGGVIQIDGNSSVTSITNQGTLNVVGGSTLNVNGNLTDSGTITVNPTATFAGTT